MTDQTQNPRPADPQSNYDAYLLNVAPALLRPYLKEVMLLATRAATETTRPVPNRKVQTA